MAHILLPTDFSQNSLNAAKYALAVMGNNGHVITVLNSFMAPHAGATVLMSLVDILGRESHEGTEMFADRLKEDIDLSGSEVRILSEHGDLPSVVANLEEDDSSIDIVVIGTQGASGLKEVLMGSNTADVVRRSQRPVLAVPEKAVHRIPKRVLIADDGKAVSASTTGLLIEMLRKWKAEVEIVRVVNEDTDAAAPSAYPALLGDIPHRVRTISKDDVETGVNDVATEVKADMIVMLRRKLGLFEGFLHRSASKRMVMHTHIPLLILEQ